jgi:hypothetical protein
MNKFLSVILVSLLFFVQHMVHSYSNSTIFPCTVEFPRAVKKIPELCIYHKGERFVGEADTTGHRTCFHLPIDRSCTTFTLLVTQGIQFESEQNTVQFLKIDPQQPYKLYSMQLVRTPRRRSMDLQQQQQNSDQWIISSERVDVHGRIPDETIILLMDPRYIDRVEGSSGFELPEIYIKENVLELAGSLQHLLDQSIELVVASLDYKPIHASLKAATRQEGEHLIIATTEA